jgi:hypothetical protein
MNLRIALAALVAATTVAVVPGGDHTALASGSAPDRPSDGRVEYVRSPLGLDVLKPRFSWTTTDLDRGDGQSAYRLRVAFDEKGLHDGNLTWDSGVVASAESTQIVYGGPELLARTRYAWDVQVTDRDGNVSSQSAPFSFEMGLLTNDQWTGQFISAPLSYARTTFVVDAGRTVARARAYVAGFNKFSNGRFPTDTPNSIGAYELSLNGARVNRALFEPNWTDSRKRVLYRTYDVASALTVGTNVVGLMMSRPSVMVQLEIDYTDGSRQTVVTDSTWRTAPSPVTVSDFLTVEKVDSRLELDWQSPTFDDSAWTAATVVTNVAPRTAALHPPILELGPIAAVAVTKVSTTTAVYDFGGEYAAMPAITVNGRRGDVVFVRYGEDFDRAANRVTRFDSQRDTFTLKGGVEQVRLHFSYRSFRYMQITFKRVLPSAADVLAIPVSTNLDNSLWSFSTSNPLFNRIHQASRRTLLNNVHGHPEDCPHREKAGWGADANAASLPMMMNFDAAAFYTKWLDDLADAQLPSGAIPSVAGLYSGEPTLIDPAWATVYPMLVWNMYQVYGDVRVIERHYDNIKRFVNYLGTIAPNYVVDQPEWHWKNDWAADRSQFTPFRIYETGYYYRDTQLLGEMAALLGKSDDSYDAYKLSLTIGDRFNAAFFDAKNHRYGADRRYTLLAQAMPIVLGLVPKGEEQAVAATLVDLVDRAGGRLPAGVIGNQYIHRALTQIGRSDLVSTFLNMTSKPSLGYMLDQGPGTIWEYWGSDEDLGLSKNHPAFTAITSWLYESLGGLSQTSSSVGYLYPVIAPNVDATVSSVSMYKTIPYGELMSNWSTATAGAAFAIDLRLPFNVTALVKLPTLGVTNPTVMEGSRVVYRDGAFVPGAPGVGFQGTSASSIDLFVGSGAYELRVIAG